MILRLFTIIENNLRLIAKWRGWEPKDRVLILDMQHQVAHLRRRHIRRDMDMQRSGMSREGQ